MKRNEGGRYVTAEGKKIVAISNRFQETRTNQYWT